MLKRNIIANYLGQGWTALMGLVFLPLYIRYLGMEAYGLVGFFAVLQSWFSLLDMGMTPTLTREMARFQANAHTPLSIRRLLRTLETVCFAMGGMIALAVFASANFIARDWMKVEKLPLEVVADALSIMALVAGLRFCEGIYRGSLLGLNKQVLVNGLSATLATVRHLGALLVLMFVSSTVKAFFLWQCYVSLFTVGVLAFSVHRSLPSVSEAVRFSKASLQGTWRFAAGMLGITLLSLLLTQVDKVLLSRLLRLGDFGRYTLAAAIAGATLMVVAPVTQGIYPRLVELVAKRDERELARTYHLGAQLVTVLIAPVVLILFLFSEGALFAWSGDPLLAKSTAKILSLLALGSFLNGLMWMPYHTQLAHGWTSLTIRVNAVAVLILIPAILWVVPRHGAEGAAVIWVILNAGYVAFQTHLMHRRILVGEKWRWYLDDLCSPLLGVTAAGALSWGISPSASAGRLHWGLFLCGVGLTALLMGGLMASSLRMRAFRALADYVERRKSS